MNDSLYIIIPAYNESENIENVVKDWYSVIEKHNGNGASRLVVIDDGSKDNSYEIMQRLAADRPLFTPIRKENSGHGATVLYGYNYALEHNADFIFQTDSDGQTLPEEFEDFWLARNDYGAIIGNRSKREDGFSRVVVTKVLKLVTAVCFGVNVTDANTPYRLMKHDVLERHIKKVPKDFNLSNVLLSVLFVKYEKVKFIPITFRPRQGGINSINIKKIFKIGRKALSDFMELRKTI